MVHGNLESVKLLVEKGANVNQRATGRFFLPEDQKTTPKAAVTDYDGKTSRRIDAAFGLISPGMGFQLLLYAYLNYAFYDHLVTLFPL